MDMDAAAVPNRSGAGSPRIPESIRLGSAEDPSVAAGRRKELLALAEAEGTQRGSRGKTLEELAAVAGQSARRLRPHLLELARLELVAIEDAAGRDLPTRYRLSREMAAGGGLADSLESIELALLEAGLPVTRTGAATPPPGQSQIWLGIDPADAKELVSAIEGAIIDASNWGGGPSAQSPAGIRRVAALTRVLHSLRP
jgi:hypothetical protein